MKHHETLGVSADATPDEIKRAYRKLAMEHHPDRGGDEATFKRVKEAYEALTGKGPEPQAPGEGYMAQAMAAMQREMERQLRTPNLHLQLSLEDAFNGTTVKLAMNGRPCEYHVRPGLPPHATFYDTITVGGDSVEVRISISIDTGRFAFTRHDEDRFTGGLTTTVEVEAIDIYLGGWVAFKDFLGQELQARVPPGFDLRHRLKVAGKGYASYTQAGVGPRGDLYLQLRPVFTHDRAQLAARLTDS